jgi:hypothetical protein
MSSEFTGDGQLYYQLAGNLLAADVAMVVVIVMVAVIVGVEPASILTFLKHHTNGITLSIFWVSVAPDLYGI